VWEQKEPFMDNANKSPVLNIDDLQYRVSAHGEKYYVQIGDIGRRLGAVKLGYNVSILPPGKRAFPRHNHLINEEMFFILEGEGEVVVGAESYPVRGGDFIACPAGPADTAHQIINTSSDSDLKFVAVSTRMAPEVVEYPDSEKFGVMTEYPGGEGAAKIKRFIVRGEGTEKEYWEGED
jgi:uncharacterized cupin superfamily protein